MNKQETADALNDLSGLLEEQIKLYEQKFVTSESIEKNLDNEELKTYYDSLITEEKQLKEKITKIRK